MKLSSAWAHFFCICFISLSGCTNAKPSVFYSKELAYIEFINKNVLTSSLANIPIQANCFYQVNNLEMSFDNGSTWISPTTYDSNVSANCQNGSFKINLTKNKAPLSSMAIVAGQSFKLLLRGVVFDGSKASTAVEIKYSPASTSPQEILVGAGVSSGPGISLKSKLRVTNQIVQTGTGISLKGRIVQ